MNELGVLTLTPVNLSRISITVVYVAICSSSISVCTLDGLWVVYGDEKGSRRGCEN